MNIKDLELLILRHGAIIFGGYVRDSILGEKPSDIDVWFKTWLCNFHVS